MRTERLESGAPLLMDHDTRDVVGVIESYSIENGMARAIVRFGESARAQEVFNDVRTGIRRNVSVGFMVHNMELLNEKEVRKGAIPIYRSDDWEPYEVSIVSVPADIAVGVGREFQPTPPPPISEPLSPESREFSPIQLENNMIDKDGNEVPTPAPAPVVETRTADEIAREAVIREIGNTAKVLGDPTLEHKFHQKRLLEKASGDPTVDEFKEFVRANMPPTINVPAQDPADQAQRQGGANSNTQLATISYRGGALKAYHGEGRLERAHRAGMFFLATLGRNQRAMQFCEANGLIRAHSGELNSTGGFLVPDELDRSIIDLRIQYGAFRRNANVAAMSSDTLIRPRRTGGLTPYFTGGGDAATESTKNWDSITLVAKKLSVLTKYENELSEDAVINIADDLTSEIAYAFAKKEDECGFNGDGSATYGGMVGVRNRLLNLTATRANISGLKVAATGHNLWSELDLADVQGVVAILPQFARQSGAVKWYCSHEFYATVLMRLAQAVGGVTATEIQNGFGPSFFGIPVEIVEVMPHVEANDQVCLLYGNLAQAATLGDRRGVTIAMSDSDGTDFAKGIMAIRGDTRFDINVHDVGNQTATAADRAPGPIVGLLTAAS